MATQTGPTASTDLFSNPTSVAPPVARYSHLATVTPGHDLLVIAGQVGNGADGKVHSSIEAQYEQALRNVVSILESVGCGAAQLVKLTYFLVEPLDREKGAEIREAVLGAAAPTTTFAYVSGLAKPEYLVEIEGLAVRPRSALV
jgi:2-iminobutanoate/2-iminopropanoate deaminase